MGITSRVGCCWDNFGLFSVDHFSVYKETVGYVHRHIYSCSLTIWSEEVEDFEIEPTLDADGQTMPFKKISDAINAKVRNEWNSKIILPLNPSFLWDDQLRTIRYDGRVNHLPDNIQFRRRKWVNDDGFNYYNAGKPVWEQPSEIDDFDIDDFINNYEEERSRRPCWTDETFNDYIDGLRERAYVVPKFMRLGRKSTSEEIAREVLLDAVRGIVDCAENDSDNEWEEQLVKKMTFELLLYEEGRKEAGFSAGYSVTGSAKDIAQEWETFDGNSQRSRRQSQ